MRIIGGSLKGKKILLPIDNLTRPLRDLVKESIFNVLEHSNKFSFSLLHSNILDLFSGSGSFGIEAISRGAKKVTFLENHTLAYKILEKNIINLSCQKSAKILNKCSYQFLENLSNNEIKFDLIFLDPPYKEKRINELINHIINKKILSDNGIIILHRHKKDNVKLTSEFNLIDERIYGISKIIIGN